MRATTASSAASPGGLSDTTMLLHIAADREQRAGGEHPARLDGRDADVQDIERRHEQRRAATVQRGVLDRRCVLRATRRRAAHRHPHRPLRRRGLQRLPRHGQSTGRGQGLPPRGRQRHRGPHLAPGRLQHPERRPVAGLRARAPHRQRQRPGAAGPAAGVLVLRAAEGDLQGDADQPGQALRVPRRSHGFAEHGQGPQQRLEAGHPGSGPPSGGSRPDRVHDHPERAVSARPQPAAVDLAGRHRLEGDPQRQAAARIGPQRHPLGPSRWSLLPRRSTSASSTPPA